ncbi:hypothetical protein AAFF_G00392420 [Aldrovandia affinis]|uniref:Uncharacterized protein n=1 Tax=Aldrovandia affinis TaxID=143900 RepID=A0AAD7WL80_9TELE|nr:hypothetical protein AAFF_G00392420 [Aldrovandia affinis]
MEHVFVISDDHGLDHDSVRYVQKLIHGCLKDDLGYNVVKLQEFSDGCAVQYKSRHRLGDQSCSLADFGFHTHSTLTLKPHMLKVNRMEQVPTSGRRSARQCYRGQPLEQMQKACLNIWFRISHFQQHPASLPEYNLLSSSSESSSSCHLQVMSS